MSRWKASGLYLLASAIVASCVVASMLLVWFPWPLFQLMGGKNLAMILVSVDVVLGPLLVLIVYKKNKRSLKFDLGVIATLQLVALGYGIYNISLARPAYLVFSVDRFEAITAKDLDPDDLRKVKQPEFARIPWGRPRYIVAEQPADSRARAKILETALQGKDLSSYPQYYVPYATKTAAVLAQGKPIELIRKRDPEAFDDFLRKSDRKADSVRFVPLNAPRGEGTVLIDAVTAEPLKILAVDPW